MTTPTVCTSCQAPMLMLRTPAGKAMPVDPEPSDRGNVRITGMHAHVIGKPEVRAELRSAGVPLFTSHFATCPNAASHRRSR